MSIDSRAVLGRSTGRGGRRIVVTGASGTVGRQVAELLAAEPSCQGVFLTRDPDSAGLGGRVAGADFADVARLTEVFADADAVLVITSNPLRPDHDANIVAAASAAGVGHLVKLSALAVADPQAQDLITSWQRAAEDRIRRSGIPWTILRPRAFMTNTLSWASDIRREATVWAPYPASRNACIAPHDIAQVARRVLLEDGHHGRIYSLTGPQPLSARDQVDHLGAVLQRPLACAELTIGQAQERWRRRYPEVMTQALTASAERQQAGAKERTTRDVEDLLGRSPTSFSSWAQTNAHLFATTA
ncbi:NAD(P)H-binding protein [Streptacidiphilus fuscans]|uniref:NAD(P)H-binding protein n=1 Tax=Streptacidiphilus fuscans TaxID=2789292 RepID=A0A931FFF1_9ACTN|nr:NAD(P)H-binding protein [Streptacidiphilus fuscans]MBF9072797.1 NAD(P)H-binding protein [Streptacidiphilus fuscans]